MMRHACVFSIFLWCFAVAQYVVATEFPDQLEALATEVKSQTGLGISTSPDVYKKNAGVSILVLPVLLFISLLHYMKKSERLAREQCANAAHVEQAMDILAVFKKEQKDVLSDGKEEQRWVGQLGELMSSIEGCGADAEQAINEADAMSIKLEESCAERLPRLFESLTRAQELHATVKKRMDGISSQIDKGQESLSSLENDVESLQEQSDINTLGDLERRTADLQKTVAFLEEAAPRVLRLQEALQGLRERFDQANGTSEEDLGDILNNFQNSLDSLESDVDEAEPDDDVGCHAKRVFALEERIPVIERTKQQALALRRQLTDLKDRLDEADGDSENYLVEIVSDCGKRIEEIQEVMNKIDEEDPPSEIAKFQFKIQRIREKLDAVQQTKEETLAIQRGLQEIEERVEQMQR